MDFRSIAKALYWLIYSTHTKGLERGRGHRNIPVEPLFPLRDDQSDAWSTKRLDRLGHSIHTSQTSPPDINIGLSRSEEDNQTLSYRHSNESGDGARITAQKPFVSIAGTSPSRYTWRKSGNNRGVVGELTGVSFPVTGNSLWSRSNSSSGGPGPRELFLDVDGCPRQICPCPSSFLGAGSGGDVTRAGWG